MKIQVIIVIIIAFYLVFIPCNCNPASKNTSSNEVTDVSNKPDTKVLAPNRPKIAHSERKPDLSMYDLWSTTTKPLDGVAITVTGPRLAYLYRSASYTTTVSNNSKKSKVVTVLVQISYRLDYKTSRPKTIYTPLQDDYNWLKYEDIKLASGESKKLYQEFRCKKRGKALVRAKVYEGINPNELHAQVTDTDTKIIGIPALHISTYDTEDPLKVGKKGIYIIEIRNEGTSPCTGIQVISHLPLETEFMSVDLAPTDYIYDKEENVVKFKPLASLQPGDKITYRVCVKAVKGGSAKHTTILKYDQFDQETLDEEGTSIY